MTFRNIIADPHLRAIYAHWSASRRGRAMPARGDIDPLAIPGSAWPYTMLLDVIDDGDAPRFRYRRVGEVFWHALARQPCGRFADEVLPQTAGYRDYVLGIYRELVYRRRPLYTENQFALHGEVVPMVTKRVSLPLSKDGIHVDMILGGHVFEYGAMPADDAFPRVSGLRQGIRVPLED